MNTTAGKKSSDRHLRGNAKMLIVFVDEEDKTDHMPLYEAIVRLLKKSNLAGATVLRGIMGFGAQERIHGSGTLGIPEDRPISIITVDDEARIMAVLPEVEAMVREGLVIVVDAFVSKYGVGVSRNEA